MPCPEALRSQESWSAFNINLYEMDAFNIRVCACVRTRMCTCVLSGV